MFKNVFTIVLAIVLAQALLLALQVVAMFALPR
jgi:hypothetical protein